MTVELELEEDDDLDEELEEDDDESALDEDDSAELVDDVLTELAAEDTNPPLPPPVPPPPPPQAAKDKDASAIAAPNFKSSVLFTTWSLAVCSGASHSSTSIVCIALPFAGFDSSHSRRQSGMYP